MSGEVRAHQETLRALKRSEMKAKELASQLEDRERFHGRLGESVDSLQAKIRQYRKQVEEAEEAAAINLAKYRRIQNELEESTQRADAAEMQLHRTRSERYTRLVRSSSMSGLHQALQDASASIQTAPNSPGLTLSQTAGGHVSTSSSTTVIRVRSKSPHVV